MCNIDLHTHTTFSDGNNTPEEMVLAAISKGLDTIGFSDHSFTAFEQSYCIKENELKNYIDCINQLKAKYKTQIKIKLGIEQDFYSDKPDYDFDYIIGSVHYIKVNGEYIPVDETSDILRNAAYKYFNGNIYDLIDEYYRTVCDVVSKTNADIIGHFDLITKTNNNFMLFDENSSRYIAAYQKACDKLIDTGKLFEINTGAIARGYKDSPYPSSDIYNYLKSKGAKFILSSDSHSTDTLCFDFDKYKSMI